MAYRRPGVTVTQEFAGLVPALAAFNLPCCVIGPAYKLFNDALLGTYTGSEQTYAYAGVLVGDYIDTAEADPDNPYPDTEKPIQVVLEDVLVQILDPQDDAGTGNATAFSDITPNVFENVKVGDVLRVIPIEGIEVIALSANGVTTDTAGQRNRLTAGTAGQFAPVKVGDIVTVTAGTNTELGDFVVTIKLNNNTLILDADVNDGVGPSTNVEFSISGDRGQANEGSYVIKTVTDENNLILQSPLPEAESLITYDIVRTLADDVALTRGTDYTADEDGIVIPIGLQVEIDSVAFDVISATVRGAYRALRTDMAAEVKDYADISAIQAAFGIDQITPANPLAYALSLMKQNTVTPINGLGLGANFVTDEALAYTSSTEALELTEMYALAPLSQNPVVHTIYKNHVEQLSLPENKLERVVLVNSRLATTMLLQDDSTTIASTSGARIIVNTQIDGGAVFATNPAQLSDPTTDQFLNVQPGDSVVIQSGTNITPGTYTVLTKNSNNLLTLSAAIITSGTSLDVQYYIVRRDGIAANGQNFYDRNANFISDGIAPGHFLEILSGPYAGRYAIGALLSEKELVLAEAIPGIASTVAGVTYEINRNLSKTEQAAAVKGYSQSLGSRRVVHAWPDVFQASFGQELIDVPGYYFCAVVAALTTGLPTHQGFTNLAVSGFLGFQHSTRYFSETQLNDIADGGTMIAAQDGPGQAVYIRHQLTTDRSAIKFQEYSVTKNVDFIAKFTRVQFGSFPGTHNIVDTTLDALRTTAKSIVTFLKEKTILPKIGGVIRSGSLTSLEESEEQIDTVIMKFNHNIPIPLNNIDITIVV